MNKREFYYPSADGKTTIHAIEWLPENVRHYKGIIQIAHGLSEHIGLYEPIARYFTDRGFIVRGNDHLGHGLSVLPGEPRLYLGPKGSWHYASDDIYTCRLLTEKEYGELPYIILGFSLGSYLVRDYLIRYGDSVDAAVLVGCLSFPKVATFFGNIVANILALFLGEKASPKFLDFIVNETNNLKIKKRRGYLDWINENEDEVKRLMADPFAMETISIGLFRELLYAIKFTGDIKNISRMNKDNPIIFISGIEDPAARNGKTISDLVDKFKLVGIKDVSYKLYEGRHRVLFEKTGPMSLDRIYDWACSKLKTEDLESMEKANPMLTNALSSMLILEKTGVKEAKILSGGVYDEVDTEHTFTLSDEEKDYKKRYHEVGKKIKELIDKYKVDVVIDIGAGFGVRGLSLVGKDVEYIGADLPAVVAEANRMQKEIKKNINLQNIKMEVADITNYESLEKLATDKKILLLIENVEEILFDFELKFANENIKRFMSEYDAICMKSEKDGVKVITKDKSSDKYYVDGQYDSIGDIYYVGGKGATSSTKKYIDKKTNQFNLSHFADEEYMIIKVEGTLDSLSASKLIDYVEGLNVDIGNKNILINLTHIDYILPAGLNALELIENKYKNVELKF